ncbi:MAG: metal-dependent transcriptional regulator [Clostridiales bacterium]|nr:metal-dependent transcriptional regulator [Clostridiales bacterium]
MDREVLGESKEDYLEAMLMLKEKNGYIRSVDIAELLGVTKPSVSNAVKSLKEKRYIEVDGSNFITLTEEGLGIAQEVYKRHKTLTELFEMLGVEHQTAAEDACHIEHILSEQTYEALMKIKDKI